MKIAIDVAGFSAAESDGFRRAMGTWRSTREMEKLHARLRRRLHRAQRPDARAGRGAVPQGRGLRQLRLQQEPCRGLRADRVRVGLPQALLPGASSWPGSSTPSRWASTRSRCSSTTPSATASRCCRWTSTAAATARRPSGSACPARRCRRGPGIERRPEVVRSPSVVVPDEAARERYVPPAARGYGIRLGPAPRQGHRRGGGRGARRRAGARRAVPLAGRPRGPDRAVRGGRRAAHPRRARSTRSASRGARRSGSCARSPERRVAGRTAASVGSSGPQRTAARPPPAAHPGAGPAAAHGARAARRRLRDPLARRAPPGHRAVPAGARRLGALTLAELAEPAAGPGRDRRARRHAPAPDDRHGARSSWRSRTRPAWST